MLCIIYNDYLMFFITLDDYSMFVTIGPSSEIDSFATKISSEIEYPSCTNSKEISKKHKSWLKLGYRAPTDTLTGGFFMIFSN